MSRKTKTKRKPPKERKIRKGHVAAFILGAWLL